MATNLYKESTKIFFLLLIYPNIAYAHYLPSTGLLLGIFILFLLVLWLIWWVLSWIVGKGNRLLYFLTLPFIVSFFGLPWYYSTEVSFISETISTYMLYATLLSPIIYACIISLVYPRP